MASGDRQRTWFPEMVEVLRSDWRPEMSWAEIIALRDQLDNMLNGIRSSRNLQPVTVSTMCPCCNEPMVQGTTGVSVRATILALSRFNVAPADEVKLLEKTWPSTAGKPGSISMGSFRIAVPSTRLFAPACKEPTHGR